MTFVPVIDTATRQLLEVRVDGGVPIGAVEVCHTRDALAESEVISVTVHLDDPDVCARFEVKAS